jgi:hypothetical protein
MIVLFRFVDKTTRAIFFRHVFLFESRPIYIFSAPDLHEQIEPWLLAILKEFLWERSVN